MFSMNDLINTFIILWAVIDPIGTVPVFLAVTKNYNEKEKLQIARYASLVAFGVLLFFLVVGELVLKGVGVSLPAFQTSGGVILFLFALNMIFGSSKPEEEIKLAKSENETAIFPLAIPSIASPGAILAIVLLTENQNSTIFSQTQAALVMTLVLFINYLLMRFSNNIHKKIGNSGAIIISKVMGLILASMAANNILIGIKDFFKL
jgi:multiple antibiotic resistance protein